MSWPPDFPDRDKVEAAFPRDVFDGARSALEPLIWLDLPEEQSDVFVWRADAVEEQLRELILIWNRLGDDRLDQIDSLRRSFAAGAEIGGSSFTIGTGEHPELDALYEAGRVAETAVRLDYKSLFLIADILLADYVLMSEVVWRAPASIPHHLGFTKFLIAVDKARAAGDIRAPFSEYMDALYQPMVEVDNNVGFYRDKFITHLPSDLSIVGSGGSMTEPLGFHVDYARRKAIDEAEHRALQRELQTVEEAEGLPFATTETDPKATLRALADRLPKLKHEQSIKTVKKLLREWGMTSPPALEVAKRLNNLLELWATTIADRVGVGSSTDDC